MSSAAIAAEIAALEAEKAAAEKEKKLCEQELESCERMLKSLMKIDDDYLNCYKNMDKTIDYLANGYVIDGIGVGVNSLNSRNSQIKNHKVVIEITIAKVQKRISILTQKIQELTQKIASLAAQIASLRVALAEALAREAAAAAAAASSGDGGSSGSGSSSSGAGSMYCFLKGTKVVTENGYKDIDKITLDDVVLSYNIATNENEYKKVIQTFYHPMSQDTLYEITINKNIISASSAHKFYIKTNDNFEWISAKDLTIGKLVMNSNGDYFPITNITNKPILDDLYNIAVEDNHNYYVTESQILVHNRK